MGESNPEASAKEDANDRNSTITRRKLLQLSSAATIAGVGYTEALMFPAGTAHAEQVTDEGGAGSYTNPVINTNTADVNVIRALDGYYYLFSSALVWPGGGDYHRLPIFRSTDLIKWTYVTDAFEEPPSWKGKGILAGPEVTYFNGKYYMYYCVFAPRAPTSVGVATAEDVTGPWTDLGEPLIPPRKCGPDQYCFVIGPSFFVGEDGTKYLYYGSYKGGLWVQELTSDGLDTKEPVYQIGHAHRYEATSAMRRYVDGKLRTYLLNSTGPCCQGPNTGYKVIANRSMSPVGPFTDHNDLPMLLDSPVPLDSPENVAKKNIGGQGGGRPVVWQNGNKWHGVGSHTVITDLAGKDWMLYYGVDKNEGWVPGLGPDRRSTYRRTLLDPIDWTENNWPIVNGGKGPSERSRRTPVTTPDIGDNFNSADASAAPGSGAPLDANWRQESGSWRINAGDEVTGGLLEQTSSSDRSVIVSREAAPRGYRLECDLRVDSPSTGRYGCVASYQTFSDSKNHAQSRYIAVFIDPRSRVLISTAYTNGRRSQAEQTTSLPENIDLTDWQHLVIEQDSAEDGTSIVRSSLATRRGNPIVVQENAVPAVFNEAGAVGFITENTGAQFDNVSAVESVTDEPVPEPEMPPVGNRINSYSDEFDGELGPQWSWIREDPSKHRFVDDQLEITVDGGLKNGFNTSSNVLVADQPEDEYVVETKLTFDPNRSFQQAGLLIYSDDDHYIKFASSHHRTLTKIVSGRETLEPQPDSRVPGEPECPFEPSRASNIARKSYSHEHCPNAAEEWGYPSNVERSVNGETAYDPEVTVWLRIYRHGDVYTLYSSRDGERWEESNSWSLEPAGKEYPRRIALYGNSGGPHNDVPARFHYVRVYELPD